MPSVSQALLAITLGVCIGVLVTQVTKLKENRNRLREAVELAQKVAVFQASRIAPPQLNLGPQLDHKMTLLLMGVDSNGRNTQRFVGTRSDTMMLASVDPSTHKVNLVSIPRDSRVAIPGHGTEKINSAHAFGGPELSVKTVTQTFNVPIDHYVVIDVQGLRKVFEALGPIDIVVEKKLKYDDWAGHLHVSLEPGKHTLTPEQAEEYVRFRHDAYGDIGRIQRQQWFMRAVSQKLKDPAVLLKLPQLFGIANEYVVTDLTADDMMKLANFGKDIKQSQVSSAMLPGRAETINGGSYWIPDMDGSAIVLARMLGTSIASSITDTLPANSAFAATTNPEALTASSPADKLNINIRYPKGGEDMAKKFEAALAQNGYKVRYRVQGASADTQHEQIIQTSFRADDAAVEKIQSSVPQLHDFAVVLNPEAHNFTDLIIVLSNDSVPPNIEPVEKSTAGAITEPEQVEILQSSGHHRHRRRGKAIASKHGAKTDGGSAASSDDSGTTGSGSGGSASQPGTSSGSSGADGGGAGAPASNTSAPSASSGANSGGGSNSPDSQ